MGSDELRMAFLLACVWFHGPPSNSQEKEGRRGGAPADCQHQHGTIEDLLQRVANMGNELAAATVQFLESHQSAIG